VTDGIMWSVSLVVCLLAMFRLGRSAGDSYLIGVGKSLLLLMAARHAFHFCISGIDVL
jgi:hypothetical protein